MRLAILALSAALVAGPSLAQPIPAPETAKPAPPKWDYGKLNALPDWRGIWLPTRSAGGPRNEDPPLTPAYQKRLEEYRALSEQDRASSHGRVASNCLPPGMPRVMNQPYNLEFTFSPDRVTIVQEAYMQIRRVYTDGRKHPEDPDPNFNGHSIGRWEGDTLVVETVGLRDDTWMGGIGVFHSSKLKITERIRLDPANADRLIIEFTFEDPEALTRPWKQTYVYARNRDWYQIEFVCAENDRNPVNADGKTLTLTAEDLEQE
jgi:hypothetical protein